MDNETTTEPDAQETQSNESGTQETQKQDATKDAELDGFTLEGAVAEIKRLRSEAASYRTSARDFQQKFDEISKLYNDGQGDWEKNKAEFESKLAALQKSNKSLELQSKLAGKVIDPAKATKLIDDTHYDEEGNFLVDKFLEDNPFLAADNKTAVNNPAHNPGQSKQPLSMEDLKGKDADWWAANFDRVKQQMTKQE